MGDSGMMGPKGVNGSKGDKGEEGLMGDPGDPGNNGTTGERGDKGKIGLPGAVGPDGNKGDTGSSIVREGLCALSGVKDYGEMVLELSPFCFCLSFVNLSLSYSLLSLLASIFSLS